jgi:hypothetical protein
MDIVLPSGITLKDVPDGLSDDEVRIGAIEQGLATEEDFNPVIDREKVVDNWNSFDEETTQVSTQDKRKEMMKGKLSSLLASGGASFENAQNNLKEYLKQYTGNEDATPESAHADFNMRVLNIRDMGTSDDIMNSIIDDLSEDTGIDYGYAKIGGEEVVGLREVTYPAVETRDAFGRVVLSLPEHTEFERVVYQDRFADEEQRYLELDDTEKNRIFEENFVERTPGGRFILGFGGQMIPEWIMPDVAKKEADSASDVIQDISGSISGALASFYLVGKAFGTLTGGRGIRIAPGVNNMLNKIALKNERASRLIESSLNSFAIYTARNQTHIDGNLKERVNRMGEDAIYSVAFPFSNQIALLPKVGPSLGLVTVGAIGASGRDKDPTERAIGATTMAMVYLLGRGMTYSRAKADVEKFVKASGMEANVLKPNGMDAKQWVDSLNKDGVIRAADNLVNIAQRQRAIADMAKTAMVKSSTGEMPSNGEKLALAKLNESLVVGEARLGGIVPIRGDRAVEQFNTTKKMIQEQPIEEPSPFMPEGFEGSKLQKLNIARTEALRRGDDVEVLRLDDEIKELQVAQFTEDSTPQIERSMVEDIDDFQIPKVGKKTRKRFVEDLQSKRPDVNSEEFATAIETYPTTKAQKLARKWVADGGAHPVNDRQMIIEAIERAEENGADPMQFKSPAELMEKFGGKKVKKIDIDTAPEFSNKTEVGDGIVIYNVDPGRNGQNAVRKLIDTDLGEKANPWCVTQKGLSYDSISNKYGEVPAEMLFEAIEIATPAVDASPSVKNVEDVLNSFDTKDGDDAGWTPSAKKDALKLLKDASDGVSEEAVGIWSDYSSVRIATKNGKLYAIEMDGQWWNKQNQEIDGWGDLYPIEAVAEEAIARQQLEAEWEAEQIKLTQETIQDQKAQIERSMLQDVNDFGIPTEQAIENIGRIPSQPFEQEMQYNDLLPAIIPPKGPTNQDLTTPEGNEWLEEKSKAMRRMTENIFGIFRKFGRQYVSDKPLAEQLEKSYHKIAAQPHFAVLDIHRKLNEFPRTSRQDRTALTIALEADDASGLPDRLLPVYEQLQGIFADAEAIQIEAGVLTQTFEEMQSDRIDDINRKIKDAKGKEREQLIAERNRLEDIKKYMPHSKVARAVMEEKAANSPVGQRNKFGKKLSQFHKQRKGTHSLREYLEQGIIDENDMDVVNLAMSAYTDAYHKIAVRSLIEWGKDNGYIVPSDKPVTNPDEWYAEDELHPIARVGGMDGMKVNRLFAQGLEELGGKDGEAYNWWDKALAITKVGAFNNPFIIGKHNISQAVLGGSAGIKNSAKAFQIVATKNDLWRQFDEAGLYQKTDIPTRVAVDELIQKMSNLTKDYGGEFASKATNILSGFFRTTPEELKKIMDDKDVKKAIEKAIMGPSMVTSGVTWWIDEFQRTNSALNLMDKGYSPEEAAREAARIHVAYSNIGDQYKKVARKILFVHAFRMLMPYELFIRPYIDVADQIYKGTTGSDKHDPKKLKRAAYVLMATVGLPALYDAWMKLNGWEVAEEERESGLRKLVDKGTIKVPLWNGEEMDITPAAFPHWKYSKRIETVDGPKEIVTTVGTPNVILTRMGVRLTQQFPQAPGKEKSKQIWNMAKSEINPLYANLFNFFHNEPLSYGEAPPMGVDGQDFVGGVGKYFEQTFQAWSFIIEQFENEMIEDKPEQILRENLNEFEKAMRFYNFAYVRSAPESRKNAMKFQLLDAAKEGANKINRMKISEEKKQKYMEEWKSLVLESADRIDGE